MKVCPLCIVAAAGISVIGLLALGGAGMRAEAAAPAAVATMNEGAFSVDSGHSSVVFRIKHLNVANFYGRFNTVSGSFSVDPAKPEATSIDIKVDANSVDTNSENRDKHLRSQDFVSVKEFADITFKSTSAKKGEGDTIAVTGDLTFRGVTKTVTVPVTHTGQGQGRGGSTVAGFETTFNIKRSDYGMKYMLEGLSDDVAITVSLEGARK